MTDRQFLLQRTIRLILWMLAMALTAGWVGLHHSARSAALVPAAFLVIMVPAVLLPLENPSKKH